MPTPPPPVVRVRLMPQDGLPALYRRVEATYLGRAYNFQMYIQHLSPDAQSDPCALRAEARRLIRGGEVEYEGEVYDEDDDDYYDDWDDDDDGGWDD